MTVDTPRGGAADPHSAGSEAAASSVRPDPIREAPVALGLMLASAAVLLLEVGQVRIFSYILWHHVTYLVVTVTLLGFAAGGTCLAVLKPGDSLRRAGLGAAMFGVLSLATFAILARHEIVVLPDADVRFPAVKATVSYLYLVIPFFFGGLSIAAALDGVGAKVSRRYAVNMIGSAAGCLLATPVLRAFGGGGIVVVAAALALVGAAMLWIAARRTRLALGAVVAAFFVLAMLGRSSTLLPFPVAAGKTLEKELNERGATLLESYWDPICRIDVVGDEQTDPALRVYQDGDAPTWIPSGTRTEGSALMANHLALGYLLAFDVKQGTSRDRALVIGVGGGHDLKTALVMGSKRVLGAEINASTAAMMKGRFAEFSGDLYNDPRVEIVVADGRSVVARSDETFDIIQITGADTYAALASGANLVAESYLYTIDAIHDYLDHLADDGVLAILRWRFHPPRETLRLTGMAAQALIDRGVADPTRHIAVVNIDSKGDLFGKSDIKARYAMTLVKPTPFTDKERALLRQFCAQHKSGYYSIAYLPGYESNEPEFAGYLTAVANGSEAAREFERAYPYAIDPVTDDRPFFFQFFRGRDVVGKGDDEKGKEHFYSVIGHGPAGLQVLWFSLAASVVLVLLLVVVPLLAFRREGLKVQGGLRMVVFFIAVGLAYLAVEIATMQRLTLYLGHPLKALGLGLTCFLVGSGLGAAISGRVPEGRERAGVTWGALLVVAGLLVHVWLVPLLFAATLPMGDLARDAIAIAVILPLAFFMGIPFPLGLRMARAAAPPLLPWAFGVNGGASVIASVVAILFAMDYGFAAALLASAGLYAIASIALPRPAAA